MIIFSKKTEILKCKIDILFFFLLLIGNIIAFLCKGHLEKLPYQFGSETIGLFIPPFLSTLYIYIKGNQSDYNNKILGFTSILLFIQYLPFGGSLFTIIKPNPLEDFDRYMQYANNMISNKTLWGGDQIIFPNENKAYITQPGYRYFVALELLLFQKLYRFVSILNIGFFITAIFFFMKTIHLTIYNQKLKKILSTIIILSIPYATKNILMGLSEWLTVTLMICFAWFYFVKKLPLTAFIILAFVPFLRQNLLPPTIIILVIHCLTQKIDLKIIAAFVLTLLLPVYHNLYYAGELRFFTHIFEWPFIEYNNSIEPVRFKLFQITNNLLHYVGFDLNNNRTDFIEESFLMLIAFIAIYLILGKYLENKFLKKWFYTTTLLSLIIPTLFLATDFYPRFEFVVIYFTMVFFLLLKTTHTTAHLPS
ncbi:MAG: hypothetical protein ACK55K_02760 [Bacteroidota bacterium]